jgi:small-conductance mechanosensitive channel
MPTLARATTLTRLSYETSFLGAAVLAGAISLLPALARFRWQLRWSGLLLALCALLFAADKAAWVARIAPEEAPALTTALQVLLWFAAAIFGATVLRFVLRKWVFPENGQPRTRKLFADLLAGLIYLVAGIGILNAVFGPSLTGLLATSGIVAVVVGLALQTTLADLFSGLALNIERPFKAGDWIAMSGGPEGQVLEINWRATRLKTAAADIVVVPNSVLSRSVVANHDQSPRARLVSLVIVFGHEVDPDIATQILIESARSVTVVLQDPAPCVFLLSCGPVGITYELDMSVADYADAATATSDALRRIWHEAKKRDAPLALSRQEVLLDALVKPARPISSLQARSR